jgi:hypothetical protein
VVEGLALMVRIREFPGSNLGPETGYPGVFRGFLHSLPANDGIPVKMRPRQASFKAIPNSSCTYHPFIRHYIHLVTELHR